MVDLVDLIAGNLSELFAGIFYDRAAIPVPGARALAGAVACVILQADVLY